MLGAQRLLLATITASSAALNIPTTRRAAVAHAAAASSTIILGTGQPVAAAEGTVKGAAVKLPSGVRYIDAKVGSGPEAVKGSRVSVQWVLRRSNGYFVDSSLGLLSSGPEGGTLSLGGDQSTQFDPFIYTIGGGGAIAGIDEASVGLQKGSIRRIVVPVSLSYTLPLEKSGGPVPSGFGPRRQIERELTKQDPQNYVRHHHHLHALCHTRAAVSGRSRTSSLDPHIYIRIRAHTPPAHSSSTRSSACECREHLDAAVMM